MASTEILFQNKQGDTFRITAELLTSVSKIIGEREKMGDIVISIGSATDINKQAGQSLPNDNSAANEQWRRWWDEACRESRKY